MFGKKTEKGIDIQQRLKGRKVVPEQRSADDREDGQVLDMYRHIPMEDGSEIKLPRSLKEIIPTVEVETRFPTYSGGLEDSWPEETPQNPAVTEAAAAEPAEPEKTPAPQPQEEVVAKKQKKEAAESREENGQFSFDDMEDIPEEEEKRKISQEEENAVVTRTREFIRDRFKERILTEKENDSFKKEIRNAIEDRLKDEAKLVSVDDRPRIRDRIYDIIMGLGPLEDLFKQGYSEIMVSRFDRVYVEKNGRMMNSGVKFGSEEELETLIKSLCNRVGRTISVSEPICDGEFREDRSRFNAVLPPIAVDGATLTIRRFPEKKLKGEDYLRFGSLDEKMLEFLKIAVEAKWTTICSGGTGSGKTSLLNLMSNFLCYDEGLSVLTIEDSLELRINHKNVRRELTRKASSAGGSGSVSARTLVKNALRQRPDVIIIGEIRDGTMADFLRAAGSGHDGCLTTIHANNPQDLESQVVVLFMMADDYSLDADTIRRMYATSVDLIVQIKRYSDHKRRISQISHVVGYGDLAAQALGIKPGDPEYSPNRVYVKDIFHWRRTGQHEETFLNEATGEEETQTVLDGIYEPTGYIPKGLLEKAEINGVKVDPKMFEKD